MTDDWLASHSGIADRLLEAIKDRMAGAMEAGGKTQRQMGVELGWDEAKVSKTLRGPRTPTAADIAAWGIVAGEAEESRNETVRLLAQLQKARKAWKDRMRQSRESVQAEYTRLYAESSRIRILQTGVVPGILQIGEYSRQVFVDLNEAYPEKPRNVDADVQARLSRGQHLYDSSKTFEIIVAESALRFAVADPAVMRLQLDRLISVTSMPNVRFGVVPLMRRIHTVVQAGFIVYDDTVILEHPAGTSIFREEEARVFESILERLWVDAVEGDGARRLMRSIMEEFADLD